MTDALRKLVAAVEAGHITGGMKGLKEFDALTEAAIPRCLVPAIETWRAYNGSLDAAKALHDSLLPGWTMDQMNEWHGIEGRTAGWGVNLLRLSEPRMRTHGGGIGMTPARAWLLAILKAKLAEDQ